MKKLNNIFLCRTFWLFFIVFIGSISLYAQHKRNYIYLFDCTKSMEKNAIWNSSKQFLHKEIENLDKNSSVTLILFHQGIALPVVKSIPSDCNWKDIEAKCDEMMKSSSKTGICTAWDKGLQYLNSQRTNYLYLFTDGVENVNAGRTDAVCSRIRNWCRLQHNNYAFFVALPSKELLNSPEINKIKKATENCDRTFYITSSFGPFGAFDKTSFNLNSHSIKNIKTGFSDYGTFRVKAVCNDPFYDVKVKDNIIKNGWIEFDINEKKKPATNHQIHFTVTADPKELHISTPDVFINIDTRNLANLDLSQPNGLDCGQYDAGIAETYSSFLFCKGKDEDTVTVNLGAVFNDEAKRKNCSLQVKISNPSNNYRYKYNGKPTDGNFTINSNDAESILEIIVPNNSSEGEFAININGCSANLETINAEETKNYASSILVEHKIAWNPLKTILFWTVIVVLALLFLWFFLLRPICYPRIRLSRITITDENGNYVNKKINGARKVVVGPFKGRQGAINRIFTRKIVYIQSTACSAVWTMAPRGHKKSVKVSLHGKYKVHPITDEFVQYGTYKLKDNNSNKEITVKIS